MRRPLCLWTWLVVIYCADEMKATVPANKTYSHIIRINSWPNSDHYRPLGDYLPGRSSRQATRDSSSSCPPGSGPGCLLAGRRQGRQVDPLHSCIEAKCSSWITNTYLDCIYRHCISRYAANGRRSASTVKRAVPNGAAAAAPATPAADDDSFGPPEGRFLLLPVAVDRVDEPQPLPADLLGGTAGSDDEERVRRREERSPVATAEDVDAVGGGRQQRGLQGSPAAAVAAPGSSRSKRSVSALATKRAGESAVGTMWGRYETSRRVAGKVGGLAGRRLSAATTTLDGREGSTKRSYNDIADVCVEHHCGMLNQHSIAYFQCMQLHCSNGRKLRV